MEVSEARADPNGGAARGGGGADRRSIEDVEQGGENIAQARCEREGRTVVWHVRMMAWSEAARPSRRRVVRAEEDREDSSVVRTV